MLSEQQPPSSLPNADDVSTARGTRFGARKQQILDAAATLFNRHGLRDATLALVASEIGLNLKSLRYYFEKKEDLIQAAFLHSIALHRQLIEDALPIPDFDARIGYFIHAYFAMRARVYRGEQPEFVHFGDLRAITGTSMEPMVGDAYIEMFRAARRLFRAEEGPWSAAQRSALAHYLIAQLLWSVVWLDGYVPEDFPRVADRLTDILLHGLARGRADLAVNGDDVPMPFTGTSRLSQESFLRAATELINAQGYRGASVERISAMLKVTKGAFYHHNETRDQLVVACFERTFHIVRQAQDLAMKEEMDGLNHVFAAAVSLVTRQMRPEGALLRTSALAAIGPELRLEMERRLALSTWRFADMLNDGLIDGSVRLCDMRIAAEAVTATVNAAEELQRWVADARPDNVAALYVRPLLSGLRSPPS